MAKSFSSEILDSIVSEIDGLSDPNTAFFHRESGECYVFYEDTLSSWDLDSEDDLESLPDWQREDLLKRQEIENSNLWIRLPDQFEIHEWEIMNDFANQLTNKTIQNELQNAIRGTGAFRWFKNIIRNRAIEDEWYAFKHQSVRQIVIDYLEPEGITFDLAENSN